MSDVASNWASRSWCDTKKLFSRLCIFWLSDALPGKVRRFGRFGLFWSGRRTAVLRSPRKVPTTASVAAGASSRSRF
eukprot:CAMPEP_0119339438 /NCGR_PEP_ID=MMETSP1333-20130426/98232_1 /TAXON_ID=418940 /ORGANISM="Scyphosphaera apsteinii, Strain RCC1455" /LENGTH=76 /DNA_ID=CAMNT_0007350949 /DNA_START=293 /DNA_END=523 /DNA_ORIENTATION=-